MNYPEGPRLDLVENLHGHEIADPYRWLEEAEAGQTEAWSVAQDDLVGPLLAGLQGRDGFRRRLLELLPGFVSPPHILGDRSFFSQREANQEHAVYCVEERGERRVLVDPAALDPSLRTTLDGAVPSKEGARLAYFLSEGGREESTLRVMDVASGDEVEGPIQLGRAGGLAWLPGGEEYFYVRRLTDAPAGEEHFHRRVWRHRVGTAVADDELVFGQGRDKSTYYGVTTSRNGRWLAISASVGTEPRNDMYLRDLEDPAGVAVAIQEGVDAQVYGGVHRDGRLYLFTNRDAPRWRLCVADPEQPGHGGWTDLLSEDVDVLTTYAVTDEAVIGVRTHDVVSRITVHDPTTGRPRGEIELPGLGTASVSTRPEGGGEDLWISYTDHVTPYTVLHHDLATGLTRTWAEPPGFEGPAGISARQIFVESADGTRVPAFVVAREGQDPDGRTPTILSGYGGFNIALSPAYSSTIAAWVEAGGVYVIANLRGGSEYGEEWHRAGMRGTKQNVFDDFIAVAEWLIAEGYTSTDHLGISGGSNGGLLVGAALTQRPDLFRAVVCSAPLLDMIRYEQFGLGVTWNDEYGRADDPTEFDWLRAYSPYHRVEAATPYPAVLFTVFDGDTRVDPLHARKLCAALQHATSSSPDERPILIRREQHVGHGARALSLTLDLQADTMCFLATQLGLSLT